MASAQDSRDGQNDTSDQNFDYMFKLLIIGNSRVGKTSFLFCYVDNSFTSAFISTVGIDFKVKTGAGCSWGMWQWQPEPFQDTVDTSPKDP
uniref:small monomeric GTPase n=1 Tax=Sphenodon punctatus TaxID=8508 RepID=A0A8D0G408_SPHPU